MNNVKRKIKGDNERKHGRQTNERKELKRR